MYFADEVVRAPAIVFIQAQSCILSKLSAQMRFVILLLMFDLEQHARYKKMRVIVLLILASLPSSFAFGGKYFVWHTVLLLRAPFTS